MKALSRLLVLASFALFAAPAAAATYEIGGTITVPAKTVGGDHAPRFGAAASILWDAGRTQLGMSADYRSFERGESPDSWDRLVGLRFVYRFPVASAGALRVGGLFSPGHFVKTTKFSAESRRRNDLIPPYDTTSGLGFGLGASLSYEVGSVVVFSNPAWNAVAFDGPDYEFFSIDMGLRLGPGFR